MQLHDFRHSCASLLINSGANISVVCKYLGHSDINETLNTYSHMFDSAYIVLLMLWIILGQNSGRNAFFCALMVLKMVLAIIISK